MYWVPEDGTRKTGRPKKTWRSTFKEDMEEMGVSRQGARRISSDRDRMMENSRRPMIREEQADISISKSTYLDDRSMLNLFTPTSSD